MTSPLLTAAAHAWLDGDRREGRTRDLDVTYSAVRYVLDTKETR